MKKSFAVSMVLLLVVLTVGVAILAAGAASAETTDTFMVESTADDVDAIPGDGLCATATGECTLRAAVQEANALPGADVIMFEDQPGSPDVYTLTIMGQGEDLAATGDLDITDDLAIRGLTETAEGDPEHVIIQAGPTRPDGIDRVFHILEAVTVSFDQLTIRHGNVPGEGGGIAQFSVVATVRVTNSTITNNEAGSAGGIFNEHAHFELIESTVSDNDGASFGGGILNGGAMTVTNSTVSGNGAGALGGGVMNVSRMYLLNSTIAENQAPSTTGGGIRHEGEGPLTMKNTIVADNGAGGDCAFAPPAAVTDSGNNLDSDGTCGLGATSISMGSALLAPLQDNGGPTHTHALMDGSDALDAADDDACPPTDQRGVTRPQGEACDIGAFEREVAAEPAAYLPLIMTEEAGR